jgi:hypothetical protein
MRTPVLALAAGLLLGLTGCAGRQATAWQDFRLPHTDFAVSMPDEPKVSEDTIQKDGTISRGYLVDQGSVAYMVHYSLFPPPKSKRPPAPDQLLDAARDELVPHMKGKLRNERRFALGETRAAELVLDVPETKDEAAYVIKARLYVRRDPATHRAMLYQSVVVGPVGYDAHPNVARFLDSAHFVTG